MVFFLSLFFGVRLYKALKSVAGGIENLHLQKPLNLPERGMTATLARKLNDVSILLYRQKLALDKRDNARTEWISGVSHDIRTPLSLIMGHADSLEQNSSLNETGKKEAASIRENSLQIRNLTGNSIRHNPEGCLIQIEAFLKNGMAELCFSDTGRGIPLAVIKALYRPASSSHKDSRQMETSSQPAPHVVGLRIVKQIVEAHHGQLEFEIQGDACRRVKISLPLCSQMP